MSAMEEKGCLLCHSRVITYFPLNKANILKIRATLPDLTLKLFLDSAVICKDCSCSLDNYSKSISDWARIEARILTSGGGNDNIDLEEICCLKDYYQGKDNVKMCRLCLIPISSFVIFTEEKMNMWDTCLSGLNLKLTINPVLCGSCDETLMAYYQFTVMCSTREEALKSYIQKNPSLPSNFLSVVKCMSSDWAVSNLRIENIVSLNETETCSRYNTRKRKLFIENDMEDDDIFDNDDEDRDPDFVLGGSGDEEASDFYKRSNKRKGLNRESHASKKYSMKSCEYCKTEVESNFIQLHFSQCEKIPLKREHKLWKCAHCSLEHTDLHTMEAHLKNCANYQTTLQKEQLESTKKNLPECTSRNDRDESAHPESGTSEISPEKDIDVQLTLRTPLPDAGEEHLKVTISLTGWNNGNSNGNNRSNEVQIEGSGTFLTSSRDGNLNLPTITSNVNTSTHGSFSKVRLNNNNNNNKNTGSAITNEPGVGEISEDHDIGPENDHLAKNATGSSIKIISNVLVRPESNNKKPAKKFTETTQCLIVMKCTMCKFNTRCNDKLYKHVIDHMSLKCSQCDLEVSEKSSMYKHLTDEHGRDFTRWYYWCVSCVQLFRARRSVESHECQSTSRRVLFKSNGTVFCMLCKFESDELKESLDHQLACLKDLNNKNVEFDAEVIEID